ncbi:MAG: hypothetical protein B7Z78_13785 [Rhodospirillales bacterium 20-60-12]|nr:MAG: hypothetical protein B7Z78_13785 [Rhodospirillales bacterium 20-60-12]
MISGIELTDGTTTITLPPPNLRITDEMEPERVALLAMDQKDPAAVSAAFLSMARKLLLMCARRNHPDLTKAQLDDFLPPSAVLPLYTWALNKAGLKMLPLELRGETPSG